MRKETILITGGAGFIGSHTADALAAKGFKIRILDNLQKEVHVGRWPSYVSGEYERIKGDVRRKKDWEKALRGVSYVIHCAAYQDQRLDFSTFFETNTTSTALLYECVLEKKIPIRKVVLASSQFVYGDGRYRCTHGKREHFYSEVRSERQLKAKRWDIVCPHGKKAEFAPFLEDQAVTPTNSYGLSKHASEETGLRLGKTYGIPTAIFRYSIVQGARQSPRNLYSGAMRIFVTQALSGKPITVYEDGMQMRDFVNVRDVVAANVKGLFDARTDFQVYNVGGGKRCKVLDFAKMVKKISGSKSPIRIGGYRRTDTRHAVSDIRKLEKLGWKPSRSFSDSIAEYLKWYSVRYPRGIVAKNLFGDFSG